ncbi:hypothetical protein N7466_011150 [Penicillium verhagenii]|uniref:uncharacterized protein n=1 Tax=Penicillium verhagenii TaxID=1562060 RepID=UPI002544DFF8|nr:uncharacterized protein N7466_011150 [Penicillium verhagenii]KAJ5917596.1 hypothetical protein N7466_011150 [Penicillium verhagenii]
MADPLSITAGIVGIVVPALQGVRLLGEELKQIRDAPENVAALRESIGSVERSLVTLETIGDKAWESLGIAENTKTTIRICGETCDEFRLDLQRWTKHSQGDTLSLRDRSKIGFWKQQPIRSMEKKLHNCQVTITEVVSIATLISSLQHSHITEVARIEKQQEVTMAVQKADLQSTDISARKKELRSCDLDDDEIQDAYYQLKQEQKALDLSQQLLKELLAKIQEPVISQIAAKMKEQSITVTFGGKNNVNSGIQFGVNNGNLSNLTFGAANHH